MAKEKKKKVGFQMYPLDWWSSETFFNVDEEAVRYRFLEMMFLIYHEGGLWMENKPYFEKRLRVQLSAQDWQDLADLFIVETLSDGGLYWHHDGISKRLEISPAQVVANRANGNRGGRPVDNPNETQTVTETKPIDNPYRAPLKKREEKGKETKPKPLKGVEGLEDTPKGNGNNTPKPPPPPLWAASLRSGYLPRINAVRQYADLLDRKIPKVEHDNRGSAFKFFSPVEYTREMILQIDEFFERASEMRSSMALTHLGGWLRQLEEALANEAEDSDHHELNLNFVTLVANYTKRRAVA